MPAGHTCTHFLHCNLSCVFILSSNGNCTVGDIVDERTKAQSLPWKKCTMGHCLVTTHQADFGVSLLVSCAVGRPPKPGLMCSEAQVPARSEARLNPQLHETTSATQHSAFEHRSILCKIHNSESIFYNAIPVVKILALPLPNQNFHSLIAQAE